MNILWIILKIIGGILIVVGIFECVQCVYLQYYDGGQMRRRALSTTFIGMTIFELALIFPKIII